MIVVNRDCDILAVDSQTERLFGFAQNEMIGNNVQILLPPRYGADPFYRQQFFVGPSASAGMELCDQRKDGTEFPIEIRASLRRTFTSSAIRDITERTEYERALEEKNSDLEDAISELDAFCYSVSHDRWAPSRAMDGFSRILLQDRSGSNLESRAAIVQRIVQRHGMRVRTEAEFNKGATFFFTTEAIPLAQ